MASCNPPVPGGVSIEVVQNYNNQTVENVFHAKRADGAQATFAQMQALAAAVEAAWPVQVQPHQSPNIHLSLVKVRDLHTGPGGAVAVQNPVTARTLSNGGTDLPLNVAFAITLRTAQGGRSFRGRVYLSGMTSSGQVDAGTRTSADRDALTNSITAIIAAINGTSGWQAGVLSKWANKVCRSQGIITPITSESADVNYDSQRRRLVGRGK